MPWNNCLNPGPISGKILYQQGTDVFGSTVQDSKKTILSVSGDYLNFYPHVTTAKAGSSASSCAK